jgi:hypothetical protein
LLIQGAAPDLIAECLKPWSFLRQGPVAPIFLNRFGSWFLRRPDDTVEMLDVLDGSTRTVAPTYEELTQNVNSREWQERHLLSRAVFDLHAAGVVASGSDCYAIAPHPALGGPNPARGDALQPEFTKPVTLRVWQSICRQSLGGPP